MSLRSSAEGCCKGKSTYNKLWRETNVVIVREKTVCNAHRSNEISLATVNMEAGITRVIHRNAVDILYSRYSHRTAESQLVQRVLTAHQVRPGSAGLSSSTIGARASSSSCFSSSLTKMKDRTTATAPTQYKGLAFWSFSTI